MREILRTVCGGWPKARRKARRIRSRSAQPISFAIIERIKRRAVSMRRFSAALAGDWPVSARNAPAEPPRSLGQLFERKRCWQVLLG